MSAKLVAYEYVPSGFEMVILNKEAKAWNLWWNVRLTDDPEDWDNQIRSINKIQDKLGELTVDQRLIRAQMAEFCRLNPLFPNSIEILCMEIGTGHFSKPVKIGCEGRSLLDSLGYHDLQSLNTQRKEILEEYSRALRKWLVRGRPENPTESKVFGFLGQSTNGKEAFVEKLVSVIDSGELSISPFKKLSEDECKRFHGETEALRGRPFNCFNCEGCQQGNSIPNCLCCYSMILDAGFLCAGASGEKPQMASEFRRFTEENILAYSVAINSWLEEAPPKHVTSLINPRYIAKDNAVEIAERVHSSLGERDEAKEWFMACLLKTIKENQRWHKRTELIDNFPEATSWLREMPYEE